MGAAADDDGAEDKRKNDLVERAKACFQLVCEAESEFRKLALEDLKFSTGEQWPFAVQQERNNEGRPCLVVNRIPQFVQQIANDQRQNRPAIKVHPVDGGADEDTAEIIQGLIRHIEYNSNAEVAYDTATENTVKCGIGWWRVTTAYASPDSFDQEIMIKRIPNPLSAYLDPGSQEPDGSDAEWGFIADFYSKEKYQQEFPGTALTDTSAWVSTGNNAPLWMRDGSACVAEFFYKEYTSETICLMSTGETIPKDQAQDRIASAQASNLECHVVKERVAKKTVIKWAKLTAAEILEETECPGRYIPIIPMYGSETNVDGKRILEGIVRSAKDPQRMLNYWKSAQTEAIALAPRAPFIIAEGQLEGYEDQWRLANKKNNAYLPYKPTSIAGVAVPPPQRLAVEPAIQAMSLASRDASDDLKAVTGIYDPTLGAGPTDMSGVAIQRRNNQSQTSNFHFTDNLTRSMRHTGRILVDWIPTIYDSVRTARIIGEDGAQRLVTLNQKHKDENGNEQLYDVTTGQYDVTVATGPSFASKRQEAAASMQEMTRGSPDLMNKIGDLLVNAMDWPGAQEMAARLKKFLPPGVADDAKGPQQIPPQVQQQIQQMQAGIQQLMGSLHAAQDIIKTDRIRAESKERIEMARISADCAIEAAKLKSADARALLDAQMAGAEHQINLLNQAMNAQDPTQTPAHPPAGAPGAAAGGAGGPPTGGQSPGYPMEP